MTISELARIASRYFTAMADAMLHACVAKAVETGESLDVPERRHFRKRGMRPDDNPSDEEWRRMVEGNSDSRWNHL